MIAYGFVYFKPGIEIGRKNSLNLTVRICRSKKPYYSINLFCFWELVGWYKAYSFILKSLKITYFLIYWNQLSSWLAFSNCLKITHSIEYCLWKISCISWLFYKLHLISQLQVVTLKFGLSVLRFFTYWDPFNLIAQYRPPVHWNKPMPLFLCYASSFHSGSMNSFFIVVGIFCFLKKVLGHHWFVWWKMFFWEVFLHSSPFARISFLTFSYFTCFSAYSQVLADAISPMLHIWRDASKMLWVLYTKP